MESIKLPPLGSENWASGGPNAAGPCEDMGGLIKVCG